MQGEQNFKQMLARVKGFVLETDGVISSTSYLIENDGREFRQVNSRDMKAIEHAHRKGYFFFIISSNPENGITRKLTEKGLSEIHCDTQNKITKLENLILKHRVSLGELIVLGCGNSDIELLKKSVIRACPSDATAQVKGLCQYVSEFKAGEGFIADLIQQVLSLQGEW